MNRLELLGRRRELLVLSARLQRANIETRLDRLEVNPKRALFDCAMHQLSRQAMRGALATALTKILVKGWRHARSHDHNDAAA